MGASTKAAPQGQHQRRPRPKGSSKRACKAAVSLLMLTPCDEALRNEPTDYVPVEGTSSKLGSSGLPWPGCGWYFGLSNWC